MCYDTMMRSLLEEHASLQRKTNKNSFTSCDVSRSTIHSNFSFNQKTSLKPEMNEKWTVKRVLACRWFNAYWWKNRLFNVLLRWKWWKGVYDRRCVLEQGHGFRTLKLSFLWNMDIKKSTGIIEQLLPKKYQNSNILGKPRKSEEFWSSWMNGLHEMPKNHCIMWTNLLTEKKIMLLYGGDYPERKGIEVREKYEFDICLRIEGLSEDESL